MPVQHQRLTLRGRRFIGQSLFSALVKRWTS
jgi:hypothetical protein